MDRTRPRAALAGWVLALMLLPAWLPAESLAAVPPDSPLPPALRFAARQLEATARTLPPVLYPASTLGSGDWSTTGPTAWTSGFFPGCLWLMYQATGDTKWKAWAQRWQAGLDSQKHRTDYQDHGFVILDSFGNGYRLTGDASYRQVVLTAADSLSRRYSPSTGCLRSKGPLSDAAHFKLNINTLMNIEILFWAARNGGNPEWRELALRHALKTRAENVRPDGSTRQLVDLDPKTGKVQAYLARQGFSPQSTWSRGQAYAIYGFTVAWRETGDARFLETARKVADYFLAHLPEDQVPYWDFQAPGIPDEPRDSSAAAIAASGLLELGQRETDDARRATYHAAARSILRTLSSPAYLAEGTTRKSILVHGTQHKPDDEADTGLIAGDYFFLEALLRLAALSGARDTSPSVGTPPPAAGPGGTKAGRRPR